MNETLTARYVDTLEPPEGSWRVWFDSEVPGGIRIMPALLLVAALSSCGSEPVEVSSEPEASQGTCWSVERASQWHEEIGWLLGSNFSPSTAINQLEM